MVLFQARSVSIMFHISYDGTKLCPERLFVKAAALTNKQRRSGDSANSHASTYSSCAYILLHRTVCRGDGMLWGQTEAVPIEQGTASTNENTAVGKTQENGHPAPTVATPLPITTGIPPAVASVATLPAKKNENCGENVAAAVAEGPKSNPAESRSNTASPYTPFQHEISGDNKHLRREGQGPTAGDAPRRRNDRRKQKPTVVREVRLVRGCPRTAAAAAATAAALLLADGSVWWVSDLHAGCWQQVTVSANGGAAAGGANVEGCLSSSGISAIAVVGLLGRNHAEENSTSGSDSGDKFVAGKKGSGDNEVAIVAGRDDGWLFLLTQRRSAPTVVSETNYDVRAGGAADGGGDDRTASPPRPWRVSAAWKGHRSRVTSVWVVGDAAHSRFLDAPEGEPQGLTAALDTSRLLTLSSNRGKNCYGQMYGALVSAGADGTVAWWKWARAEDIEDAADDGSPGSCRKSSGEVVICAPRLRMVSRACRGNLA